MDANKFDQLLVELEINLNKRDIVCVKNFDDGVSMFVFSPEQCRNRGESDVVTEVHKKMNKVRKGNILGIPFQYFGIREEIQLRDYGIGREFSI